MSIIEGDACALFSVWWFDPDGNHYLEQCDLDGEEAVKLAHSLTTRPAAQIGVIRKVIIVDDGDCTNFEWQYGKGVTYPCQSSS